MTAPVLPPGRWLMRALALTAVASLLGMGYAIVQVAQQLFIGAFVALGVSVAALLITPIAVLARLAHDVSEHAAFSQVRRSALCGLTLLALTGALWFRVGPFLQVKLAGLTALVIGLAGLVLWFGTAKRARLAPPDRAMAYGGPMAVALLLGLILATSITKF